MIFSLWKVLVDLGPALLPVFALLLVLFARALWNHEKRLRELERAQRRVGRSVYGDDEDIQQTGLSQDVQDVIERLDRLESKVDELNNNNQQ